MSSRNNEPDRRRAIGYSRDDGETWDEPALDEGIPTAPCQGSLIAGSSDTPPAPLLLSNPAWTEEAPEKPGKIQRKRLTVWLSPDSGRTWPHARIVQPGRAEYSNLIEITPGRFACFYERGAEKLYHVAALTFARFDWDWLQAHNEAADIRSST
jgi:sialidase-1